MENKSLYSPLDNWDRQSHPLKSTDYGVFEIFLPNNPNGSMAIPHNSKVKARFNVNIPLVFINLFNDPSAGLPTETLLRILLPLNDQVC
jgi:hypothetical protein